MTPLFFPCIWNNSSIRKKKSKIYLSMSPLAVWNTKEVLSSESDPNELGRDGGGPTWPRVLLFTVSVTVTIQVFEPHFLVPFLSMTFRRLVYQIRVAYRRKSELIHPTWCHRHVNRHLRLKFVESTKPAAVTIDTFLFRSFLSFPLQERLVTSPTTLLLLHLDTAVIYF